MKLYVLLFLALIAFSCSNKKSNQEKIKTNEFAEIEFDEDIHDFGVLTAGEIVLYTFVFRNTGENDFIIENINSDCGCVQVNYTEKPVEPGEKGQIEVELNSSGLMGRQLKTIEIKANCKETKQLVIFADVKNEQIEIRT